MPSKEFSQAQVAIYTIGARYSIAWDCMDYCPPNVLESELAKLDHVVDLLLQNEPRSYDILKGQEKVTYHF